MENNKLISGIYLVYIRWDLIWFENKIKNESFTVKYPELQALLLQHFDSDYCKKILESINKFEKVIIDFDKDIVRKVIEKDIPYTEDMKKYFTASYVADNYDPIARIMNVTNL